MAAQMVLDICGGRIVSPLYDIQSAVQEPRRIAFPVDLLKRLGGLDLGIAEQVKVLEALHIKVLKQDERELLLEVGLDRIDVLRPVDVVEEIMRVWGLDRVALPGQMRFSPVTGAYPGDHQLRRRVSEYLLGRGLHETMGLSLVPTKVYERLVPEIVPQLVQIHNTSTVELDALRSNLAPTGLQVITYNQNRQRQELQFFEFGKAYLRESVGGQPLEYEQLAVWVTGRRQGESWAYAEGGGMAGFAFIRGLAEGVVQSLGLRIDSEHATRHGDGLFEYGQDLCIAGHSMVSVGKVSAPWLEYFDCRSEDIWLALVHWSELAAFAKTRNKALVVREPSRFPQVRRDLAMLIEGDWNFGKIVAMSRASGGSMLQRVELFDVFEDERKLGAGKRSYALRYVFERSDRTMTDEEIDKSMQSIIRKLESEPGLQVRR